MWVSPLFLCVYMEAISHVSHLLRLYCIHASIHGRAVYVLCVLSRGPVPELVALVVGTTR